MGSIQAKMRCESITNWEEQEDVTFRAVTGTSEENKFWSKYTPSGTLSLSITNEHIFRHFQPGKEYIISIDEA